MSPCTDCAQWGCTMNCGPRARRFTANPSEDRESGQWFVWDASRPLPPMPVYVGTMDECGLIADALNAATPSPAQTKGEG